MGILPVPALFQDSDVTAAFSSKYSGVSRCGSGGQAIVYRAAQVAVPHADVAIKVYVDSAQTMRSDREVHALRSLSCNSIVGLVENGLVRLGGSDRPFLITNWVDGELLSARIRRGSLPPREVLQLATDVADAIEALWAATPRLVHRDIKPANIIWTPAARAVVIDLGLARHVGVASLSAPHERWGTNGYRAPEQVMHPARHLTLKADVFALGITMQESLLGRHPTPNNDMIHAAQGGLPTLGLVPGAQVGLAALIDSMVRINAHRRPLPLGIRATAARLLGTLP